jgi:hypothetical protein
LRMVIYRCVRERFGKPGSPADRHRSMATVYGRCRAM